MVDIIPENIENAVVCNVVGTCSFLPGCEACHDVVVGIHNWIVATDQRYVILDFQDEKEVCPSLIEELIQLRKRLPIPFLFAGVMEKPKQHFCTFDYRVESSIFRIPEDAIEVLKKIKKTSDLLPETLMTFGEPLMLIRSRYSHKFDYDGEDLPLDEVTDGDSEELGL